MAKRLIDAAALETDLRRQYDEVFGNARKTVNPDDFYIERVAAYKANVVEAEQKGFFEYLKTRPTVDAVEVCYCKDCKNYTNMDVFNGNRLDFHWCSKFRNIMSEDDFCSYGERKEG